MNKKQRLTIKLEEQKRTVTGKFKQLRQQVHKLLHSAHWIYMYEVIRPKCSDNPKPFFGYIKKIKRDSFGIQGLKDQGQIVTESKPKADILSNKFESVFTTETPVAYSPCSLLRCLGCRKYMSPHLESRNCYIISTHPRQLVQMAFQLKI